MSDSWRYIPLITANGTVQMSIDRWLLEQYDLGGHPPLLRFYTWSPVAISLGYHQRQYPDYWNSLIYQGQPIDLVPRPTGGRAVLHQGDLCYSLITSDLSGSRHEVYVKICQFLEMGWRSLGIDLTYGERGKGYIHLPSCFGTATSADLVDQQGIKRIGSAQLRRKKTILQQGSMSLQSDAQLYQQIFTEAAPTPLNIAQDSVIASLEQAAEDCFGMRLVKQPLQEKEWELIHKSR